MSLELRCCHQVLPGDRRQGEIDYQKHRVTLGLPGLDSLAAQVRDPGTGARTLYVVALDWSQAETTGVLYASCECPRFADQVVCQHVFATLLACDQELPGLVGTGNEPLDIELESPESSEIGGEAGTPFSPRSNPDRRTQSTETPAGSPGIPFWRRQLASLRNDLAGESPLPPTAVPLGREVSYGLNLGASRKLRRLVVDFFQRKAKKDGQLGKRKPLRAARDELRDLADPEDRAILDLLLVAAPALDPDNKSHRYTSGIVPAPLFESLLPRLCATGRFTWSNAKEPPEALAWERGSPWQFVLELRRDREQGTLTLQGALRRDGEKRPLSSAVLLLVEGLVVFRNSLACLDPGDAFPWISLLRNEGNIVVPQEQLDPLLEELFRLPRLPPLDLDPQLEVRDVQLPPRPRIAFRSAVSQTGPELPLLTAQVSFIYGTQPVSLYDMRAVIPHPRGSRLLRRDPSAEQAALEQLADLGFKRLHRPQPGQLGDYELPYKAFLKAVERLIGFGWVVEAEGQPLRPPGAVHLQIHSGINWFDLGGKVDFGSATLDFPELLRALRRREPFVPLDDGSQGVLPLEWLERYGLLADLAQIEATESDPLSPDRVRFVPAQAILLDALLPAETEVTVDARYDAARRRLRTLRRLEPGAEPPGFEGELRPYQRHGLGWLAFLEDFGFGGCLADDMGLGKTVQVLAHLENRRLKDRAGETSPPSLVVVPRSLVHNWMEESRRFTPQLRVLDYTGAGRLRLLPQFKGFHLVVTTYGLLRRDFLKLREVEFDYVILDEAQAIKNVASQAAKACRLLQARHRLAMTGTPVENHLGELWSLFEFTNPGLLGRLPTLAERPVQGLDRTTLATLAAALEPLILRRTKEQVLADLPPKTEQTLVCELDPEERELYDQLRSHFRRTLHQRIHEVGLERSRMQVLEALLRLRQAACHPGLLDPTRNQEPSAKLETLTEQLHEVLGEGHKALVFSQFTRLLAIVRRRLDESGIAYEYLDGQSRKRQERVDHFQESPECRVFLISLKAGGVGLNLTAADYVFILDPWWNPAVETQAVDRAHRLGQTRPVFAYRLICRDTVEEKILDLQRTKRDLADALLTLDQARVRDLSSEDLRLLLG